MTRFAVDVLTADPPCSLAKFTTSRSSFLPSSIMTQFRRARGCWNSKHDCKVAPQHTLFLHGADGFIMVVVIHSKISLQSTDQIEPDESRGPIYKRLRQLKAQALLSHRSQTNLRSTCPFAKFVFKFELPCQYWWNVPKSTSRTATRCQLRIDGSNSESQNR